MKQAPHLLTYNHALPKAIICDIDGTLAFHAHRGPYDTEKCDTDDPNLYLRDILRSLKTNEIHILLVSGREEKFRDKTEAWLSKHAIPKDWLYMRPTGDKRPDTIIKKEIYDAHIKGKYTILGVFDDRKRIKRMWVSEGIFVYDCNQQDIEY